MSKFIICSKTDCETICHNPINDKTFVVISINSPNELPYANLARCEQLKDILYVYFNDVEEGGVECITERDAELIYNFADYYFNNSKVDKIIIHCGAGISRSAGVAAALMKIYEGDDWPIFNTTRYCPNMTCYRKVLEQHFGRLSETEEQELSDKKQKNIELLKELYWEDLL